MWRMWVVMVALAPAGCGGNGKGGSDVPVTPPPDARADVRAPTDTAGQCPVIPEGEMCGFYCGQVCQTLTECGVSWAQSCLCDCYSALHCPGETVGHDDAICEDLIGAAKDKGCYDLCLWVGTDQSWGDIWGGECESLLVPDVVEEPPDVVDAGVDGCQFDCP